MATVFVTRLPGSPSILAQWWPGDSCCLTTVSQHAWSETRLPSASRLSSEFIHIFRIVQARCGVRAFQAHGDRITLLDFNPWHSTDWSRTVIFQSRLVWKHLCGGTNFWRRCCLESALPEVGTVAVERVLHVVKRRCSGADC